LIGEKIHNIFFSQYLSQSKSTVQNTNNSKIIELINLKNKKLNEVNCVARGMPHLQHMYIIVHNLFGLPVP